jgi:uncharacterized protein YcsI (UPF0317 family)
VNPTRAGCRGFDVTDPGDPHPRRVAPEARLRTDLPRHRVYRQGGVAADVYDIQDLWRDDLAAFLLGCSFTAEGRLLELLIPYSSAGSTIAEVKSTPCFRRCRTICSNWAGVGKIVTTLPIDGLEHAVLHFNLTCTGNRLPLSQ